MLNVANFTAFFFIFKSRATRIFYSRSVRLQCFMFCFFLDASMHFYERFCLSVRPPIYHASTNNGKNGLIRIGKCFKSIKIFPENNIYVITMIMFIHWSVTFQWFLLHCNLTGLVIKIDNSKSITCGTNLLTSTRKINRFVY